MYIITANFSTNQEFMCNFSLECTVFVSKFMILLSLTEHYQEVLLLHNLGI